VLPPGLAARPQGRLRGGAGAGRHRQLTLHSRLPRLPAVLVGPAPLIRDLSVFGPFS
jgi:hypothetical protein